MMRLPAKRERVRSGILRAPKREWPKHQKFIRRHTCVVTLGKVIDECDGRIECAHVRLGAKDNGKSIKPHIACRFVASITANNISGERRLSPVNTG